MRTPPATSELPGMIFRRLTPGDGKQKSPLCCHVPQGVATGGVPFGGGSFSFFHGEFEEGLKSGEEFSGGLGHRNERTRNRRTVERFG